MTPIKIPAESLTVSTAGDDLAGAIICPIMQVRYVFSKAIVRPTTSPCYKSTPVIGTFARIVRSCGTYVTGRRYR